MSRQAVESLPLEILKTQFDTTLGNYLQLNLLNQRKDQMISRGVIQTHSVILPSTALLWSKCIYVMM